MSQRQPPRGRGPRQPAPPYGPRGGLAGASDDFASYLKPRASEDPDWAGWSARGVYGRGADLDRIVHRDFEPPDTDERVDQDFVERADRDFGGRDTAGWYARHGSNADRQQARRRWQAEHADADPQADSLRGLAPAGYRRSDQRILDDLHQRLTEDPWVDARAVELLVQDGHVSLRGQVDQRSMKHRCEDIAAVCPGVTRISNEIRVRKQAYTRADQRAP